MCDGRGTERCPSSIWWSLTPVGGVAATECFIADLAVADGRIVALGERLPEGREELDANGFWLTPGSIDSHCHIDTATSIRWMWEVA